MLAQLDKVLVKEGLVLQVGCHLCCARGMHAVCNAAPAQPVQPMQLMHLQLTEQVQHEGDGVLVFLRLVVVEQLAGDGCADWLHVCLSIQTSYMRAM